jgi:hypothetical protein
LGRIQASLCLCGLLSALAPFALRAEAQLYSFAPGEFEAIQAVAVRILAENPPDTYKYVFVGGSPTPLEAYFRAKGIAFFHLPFSRFKFMPWAYEEDEDSQRRVFESFDPFVSALREQNGKVLVVDKVTTGESVLRATEMLHRYAPKVQLELLGLYWERGRPEGLTKRKVPSWLKVRTLVLPDIVQERMRDEAYDNYRYSDKYAGFSARGKVGPSKPFLGLQRAIEIRLRLQAGKLSALNRKDGSSVLDSALRACLARSMAKVGK